MAGRLQDAEICAGRGRGRTGLDEMNFKDPTNKIKERYTATEATGLGSYCAIFAAS